MISERNCLLYCNEQLSHIENYEQAINDKTQMWQCHHRKETDDGKTKDDLIKENLYFFRPACELIFLTTKEHRKLHSSWNKGKTRDEIFSKDSLDRMKTKCSLASKGENNPMFGYKWSDEQRKQMSKTQKDRHFTWQDKDKIKMSTQRKGLRIWNNGHINVRSKECPGEEFVAGRLSSTKNCIANRLISLRRYNKKRIVGILHTIFCCYSNDKT